MMHDHIVKDLTDRLRASYPYEVIKTFFLYPGGEIDIVRHHKGCGVVSDYEIKSHDNYPARHKAIEQLMRAYDYWLRQFRGMQVESYYVCGDKKGTLYTVIPVKRFDVCELTNPRGVERFFIN